MGLFNDLSCEAGSFSCFRPTPRGVFTQRFEVLFPCTGALGYGVCFTPRHSSWFMYARMWGLGVLPATLPAPFSTTLSPALLVYLCTNVGSQGQLVVRHPAPFIPHPTSLGRPRQRESSPPRLPISAPPIGLDECLFFITLVSDFLDV